MNGTLVRRSFVPGSLLILALGVLGLLGPALMPAAAGPLPEATPATPVVAALNGPTTVGETMLQNYTVTASGGPAQALNGTIVGTYTYKASFNALNRTGIVFGQSAGVLTNGSVTLQFTAPNVTEVVTLAVLLNSSFKGQSATQNITLNVNIVQPYVIATTLVVGSGAGLAPFYLTVSLDGTPVGQIHVAQLTAGQSFPIRFRYVDTDLAPGWHTFSISLAAQHGLVTFPGGTQSFSSSFYVSPPAPDTTFWFFTGFIAFFGAIVIWMMRVGARRRGKPKK